MKTEIMMTSINFLSFEKTLLHSQGSDLEFFFPLSLFATTNNCDDKQKTKCIKIVM